MNLKSRIQNYIPPDPERRAAFTDVSLVSIGFFATIIGCVLVFSLLYSDSKVQPVVQVAPSEWHVIFDDTGEHCGRTEKVPQDCVSAPDNQRLWNSQTFRETPAFKEHFKNDSGAVYWIGGVITADRLKKAASESATALILPSVHGVADVWVDGVFLTNHRAGVQALPLQVSLSLQRLTEPKDLYVAMRVLPYPHYLNPDVRNTFAREGFFPSAEADRLTRWSVFSGMTRHLIVLGLFLLLARILWTSSRKIQLAYDYIVGAQLSLLLAVISLASMDIALRLLAINSFYSLYFTLLVLEAIFIVRLTASILRASRSLLVVQFFALIAVAAAVYIFTPWTWIETRGILLATSFGLPLVYISCAFAIGMRATQIMRKASTASRERIEFLFLTCYSIGLTGACYFFESYKNPGVEFHWSRSLNLITVYFLIRLIARNQAKVAQPKVT